MELEEIKVIFKAQTDQFKNGVKSMERETKQFESTLGSNSNKILSSIKGIGMALASVGAVKAMYSMGKQAVSYASELQEVQNVVDVAFGDMKGEMEKFAKTSIQSFGMSETTAKRAGSTFMSMAKGLGISGKQASEMSLKLTSLVGDTASFYNITQEVAQTKLASIFTGETEALKQLGIVMIQTNLQQYAYSQGISKQVSAMNQAEQTILRYNYVVSQLGLAQGDFARTSDSWANQIRLLKEQLRELLTIIGQGILVVLSPLIKGLNQAFSYIVSFARKVQETLSGLFGKSSKKTQDSYNASLSTGADNLATYNETLKDTGSTAKKTGKELSGALAGFDELNNLSTSGVDNIGVAGGEIPISISPIDTAPIDQANDEVERKTNKLSEFFKTHFGEVYNLATTIISDCVAMFNRVNDKVFKPIIDIFNILMEKAILPLAKGFGTVLMDAVNSIASRLESLWHNILVPVGNFLIDELGREIEQVASIFKNILAPAFDFTGRILQNIYQNYFMPFVRFINDTFRNTFESVGKAIEKVFSNLSQNAGSFKDNFSNIIEKIKDICSNIISWISNFFKDGWKKAWEGIVSTFDNIMKGLGAVVKQPLNSVISIINKVISSINSISIKLPNWIPGDLGGKTFGVNIKPMQYLAKGGIVDGPTHAIVGEAGTEAIIPLERNTQGLEKLSELLANKNSTTVKIYLNGKELKKLIKKIDSDNDPVTA